MTNTPLTRADTLEIRGKVAETKLQLLRNALAFKTRYNAGEIEDLGGSSLVGRCMRDLRTAGEIDAEGHITAAGRATVKAGGG